MKLTGTLYRALNFSQWCFLMNIYFHWTHDWIRIKIKLNCSYLFIFLYFAGKDYDASMRHLNVSMKFSSQTNRPLAHLHSDPSSSPPMILHINHSIKTNPPHALVVSARIFILMAWWAAETIIQHCFESIVFSRCFQAFVGTPLDSDTDYLPLKDTSVNPARLLFSLKWTEYLITLIYRILLSKAARYLAVTGSLINIIIRIFTPPALSRVFIYLFFTVFCWQSDSKTNLWSKGQSYLSWDIMDLLEKPMGCYWCLQTSRDYTQAHINALAKMKRIIVLRDNKSVLFFLCLIAATVRHCKQM